MSLPFNQGLSYVPIPASKKGPITPGWNQRESCITEATEAYRLSGNVGLAHAYCETPTCAVDIDDYKETRSYLSKAGIDLKYQLTQRNSAVMWSGRPNSLKAIYRLPKGLRPLLSKTIKVNGKTILEFRCAAAEGKTVQDVIPPSVHPSGTKYRWLQGSLEALTEISNELLNIWQELIAADKNKSQAQNRPESLWYATAPLTPREVAILKDQLNYIDPNCDRETWRNVVWAVLSTGLADALDIALKWSEKAPDKFDIDEFYTLNGSYIEGRTGLNGPITLGTIYHHARDGGWNG